MHVFEWYNEIVAKKKKSCFKVAFLKPLIQIKRCRISLPEVERNECEPPFSMMYEVILPNKKGAESSKIGKIGINHAQITSVQQEKGKWL